MLTVRPAGRGDAALVLRFFRSLAAYEERGHEVVAGESDIDTARDD